MTQVFASAGFWWLLLAGIMLAFAYHRVSLLSWTIVGALAVLVFVALAPVHWSLKVLLMAVFAGIATIFNVTALRRRLISEPLLRFYRASMPDISATEREALEAGTVWWDAELFSGRPRWRQLLGFPAPESSAEEQAFLSGPVEQLCGMLDDFEIDHRQHDLPPEVWQFLKENGFFGMILPKEYGGREFSAAGHASVVMKIATRSVTAALTVMIPNSVGPGKLLLKYGTQEQKDHYLPRLARGEDIPCFALTAPQAGSDAGAIPDIGIVCRQEHQGQPNVLGVRLNFDKRYITLGPVATVLGLAFKLRDPDHLLGQRENLGITLALVPANAPGVTTGSRHNPLQMAFQNGPVSGRDVFVPMGALIGGVEKAGKGWRMLIECLTDGRAISLPALSTGAAKISSRLAGAYARVRRQFNTEIGNFEGIQEALAVIGGNTYAMDAARRLTLAALDAGHKPAVISAIVKYNLTERARIVINQAMQVHGGAGVCAGPRNPFGQLHNFPPMAATVEGANILTRTLITFGQGAIRCHPYLLRELEAAGEVDAEIGVKEFDRALTAHIGFAVSNAVRAFLLALSGSRFNIAPPGTAKTTRRYYRHLTRMSAAFAILTDALVLTLRGELKRRERLSGRMADALSQLYLASAALKHFADLGNPKEDEALMRWACEDALFTIQQSFDVLLRNLPNRPVAWALRALIFPLGRHFGPARDSVGSEVARLMQQPGPARDRLTAGMYIPDKEGERIAVLDDALVKITNAASVHAQLLRAVKAGTVTGADFDTRVEKAVAAKVLTKKEAAQLREAEAARLAVVQVDDFEKL